MIVEAQKIQGSEAVYEHVCKKMNRLSDIQMRLRAETEAKVGENVGMLSAPDQCQLMEQMVRISGARRGIEVGVFTGYSALSLAKGLPADGKLIALDIEEKFVNIGRPFWKEAGVADRIDVRIGPALDSLDELLNQQENHSAFDFSYIDADKLNYHNYVERLLPLLKPNGFIMMDNTLWKGRVADAELRQNDETTAALHNLVKNLLSDERVEVCSIMLADGFTLARKL